MPRAEALDRGEPGREVESDVDDTDVGRGIFASAAFDDADGNAAGAQQLRGLAAEFLVLRNNERGELGHVKSVRFCRNWGRTYRVRLKQNRNACAAIPGRRFVS